MPTGSTSGPRGSAIYFHVDAGSPHKDQIILVMRKTANGLNDDITLSDVLNKYTYDSYKVYRDGLSEEEARLDCSIGLANSGPEAGQAQAFPSQ